MGASWLSMDVARGWLAKKPVVTLLAVLLLLGFALRGLIFGSPGSVAGPIASDTYYLDTQTGELLMMPAGQILPARRPGVDPESPPTLAQAYVFSCGQCDDRKSRFTGYVLTHNPTVVEQAGAHGSPVNKGVLLLHLTESPEGMLVQGVDRKTGLPVGGWVPQKSAQGTQVMSDAAHNCPDGGKALRCEP